MTTIHPQLGPETGGTQITITGFHFLPQQLACKFGNILSPQVIWINNNTIICIAPSMDEGEYPFRISQNYKDNIGDFWYHGQIYR